MLPSATDFYKTGNINTYNLNFPLLIFFLLYLSNLLLLNTGWNRSDGCDVPVVDKLNAILKTILLHVVFLVSCSCQLNWLQ